MKRVYVTTDGACIGNPGPGGWACILRYLNRKREIFGSEISTTNNRMELRAVIEGLNALKEPCDVVVVTDSQYVKNGITQWLMRWKSNGWRKLKSNNGKGKAVMNQDLWLELDRAAGRHTVSWQWVKGHAENLENVRCDELAVKAAREQILSS